MTLYRFSGYQAYWTVYYKNKEIEKKYLGKILGNPLENTWEKCELEVRFKGEYGNIEPDIIDFGGTSGIVLNSRAKDILQDLILPNGELLPVELNGNEFYIVNPTIILDCVDFENSIMEKKPPLYKEKVRKYVFKKDCSYPPVFRLKNERVKQIVDDSFVIRLKQYNLIGYTLQKLWNSDDIHAAYLTGKVRIR